MKRKIILIIFVLNSLFLLIYIFPLLQGITHIFFDSNSAAIGIIGGADGPTAIFIASQINWFPVAIVLLEIILGISLFLSRSKK